MRILVEILHVGMRRRRIEVEVVFLDILTVIALVASQSENALFQDGVASVPQRHRETDRLLAIADARETILIPAIGSGARVIMRKVLPSRAVSAIVLAHRAPRSFTEVGSPAFPVLLA